MTTKKNHLKSHQSEKISSLGYYSGNDLAQNYDAERFSTVAGRMMNSIESDVVISNVPSEIENPIALDAGAGSGRFTIELAKRGIQVVACDYSSAMLSVIESKARYLNLFGRIDLTRQDLRKLAFPEGVFDYVFSIRVTVNLDTEDNVRRAVSELLRVCRPGGTVVLDFVNRNSLAALGIRKESMIDTTKMKSMIGLRNDAVVERFFGRRIISQTAFERCPSALLGLLESIDRKLSKALPSFCVRNYFVIRKLGDH